MKKLMFLDTETTGLYPFKHSPYDISGIIEVGGEVKESFSIQCKPLRFDNITQEALDANGMTIEKLENLQLTQKGYKELLAIWDGTVDKYNTDDKMVVIGHNVDFDIRMLNGWFKNLDNNFFYSYVNRYAVDTFEIAKWLLVRGLIPQNIENLQLETLCRHFKLIDDIDDGNFHKSALYDIEMNKKIYEKFNELLKGEF